MTECGIPEWWPSDAPITPTVVGTPNGAGAGVSSNAACHIECERMGGHGVAVFTSSFTVRGIKRNLPGPVVGVDEEGCDGSPEIGVAVGGLGSQFDVNWFPIEGGVWVFVEIEVLKKCNSLESICACCSLDLISCRRSSISTVCALSCASSSCCALACS